MRNMQAKPKQNDNEGARRRVTVCLGRPSLAIEAWLCWQKDENNSTLAETLGVSRQSVMKYLQGTPPGKANSKTLSEMMGVTYDEIRNAIQKRTWKFSPR